MVSVIAASLLSPQASLAQSRSKTDAGEQAKDIIASQLRRQGVTCDQPESAERDSAASTPNETVWVLRCKNAAYRVRLVPDMAAAVDRID